MHLYINTLLTYAFIAILGIVVGNISTTILYRIPRQISIFAFNNNHNKPFCSKCRHPLRWFEVLPIIGFLINRGICRYCGSKVPLEYVALEVLTGITSVVLYALFGLTEPFLILLLLSCAFLLHIFTLILNDSIYIEITASIVILCLIMFTLIQGTILYPLSNFAIGSSLAIVLARKKNTKYAQIALISALWLHYIYGCVVFALSLVDGQKKYYSYLYFVFIYFLGVAHIYNLIYSV